MGGGYHVGVRCPLVVRVQPRGGSGDEEGQVRMAIYEAPDPSRDPHRYRRSCILWVPVGQHFCKPLLQALRIHIRPSGPGEDDDQGAAVVKAVAYAALQPAVLPEQRAGNVARGDKVAGLDMVCRMPFLDQPRAALLGGAPYRYVDAPVGGGGAAGCVYLICANAGATGLGLYHTSGKAFCGRRGEACQRVVRDREGKRHVRTCGRFLVTLKLYNLRAALARAHALAAFAPCPRRRCGPPRVACSATAQVPQGAPPRPLAAAIGAASGAAGVHGWQAACCWMGLPRPCDRASRIRRRDAGLAAGLRAARRHGH